MALKTPLKWAGSKARIMNELEKHLPAGKRLVEPFAGSCAVMMNTDYEEYLIGDVNPDLINFYQQLVFARDRVLNLAESLFITANTAEDYYRFRHAFNYHNSSPADKAAVFLYLNRHCYNGLARYNLAGKFNVPYGKYKAPYFPEAEIHAFAEKAKRATFICADFSETLGLVRSGDVIYCDPPYNPLEGKSSFTKYHAGEFGTNEQQALSSLLYNLAFNGHPVIASNSDCLLTRGQYGRFDLHPINAPRSIGTAAGESKTAPEIIATRFPQDKYWFAPTPVKGREHLVEEALTWS